MTGLHRGGSTWSAKVLAAAPGVGYIREPFHPGMSKGVFRAPVKCWYPYVSCHNQDRYHEPMRETLAFDFAYGSALRQSKTLKDFARVVRDASHFSRHRRRNDRAFIKDPFAFFATEWIAQEFDATVLILLRNPFGFVSSCKRLNWSFSFENLLDQPELMRDHLGPYEEAMRRCEKEKGNLLERTALFWKIIFGTISKWHKAHPDWMLITHEALCEDAHCQFKELFTALGLTYTDEVASIVGSVSDSGGGEAKTGQTHTLNRNSKAVARVWRERLSDDEVECITAITTPELQEWYPQGFDAD